MNFKPRNLARSRPSVGAELRSIVVHGSLQTASLALRTCLCPCFLVFRPNQSILVKCDREQHVNYFPELLLMCSPQRGENSVRTRSRCDTRPHLRSKGHHTASNPASLSVQRPGIRTPECPQKLMHMPISSASTVTRCRPQTPGVPRRRLNHLACAAQGAAQAN